MNPILAALQQRAGVVFMGQPHVDFQKDGVMLRATPEGFACDSQPSLVTVSNSGIPAFLSTFIDPNVIDVLVSPMKAAEIVGNEVKKGDWTMSNAQFPVVESTGETSSYGDYSNDGQSGANVNWPARQSYHYQTITQWGERELEMMGLAKIDWANRQNIASVLTLNKYQNKTYFFGVAGLQNYGLLNDPSLYAPISPVVKTAGGTGWTDATGLEVYADIQTLFKQLQTQSNGLVQLDSPMKLVMSSVSQVALTKVTQYNVNVMYMLEKNFPNLKVDTAPEYATDAGELVQLIVESIDGQRTVDVAFTEKLRAHPIVVDMSSFRQKKSQGTWGAIVYRPFAISQMIGV